MPPMKAKAKMANCDTCAKTVGDRDKAFSCGGCLQWRHAKCFRPALSDDAFALMESYDSFQFLCNSCSTSPGDNNNTAIAQAINGLNATIKMLSDRLAAVEEKVNATPPPPQPTETEDVKALVNEAILQHENRSQVVVCNVPEGGDDHAYVHDLFDHLGVRDYNTVEIYRMGVQRSGGSDEGSSPKTASSSPRLLKVRLARSSQRDQVLESAKKLRDDEAYPVYIRPSYTQKERRCIGSLYDQKRELEEAHGKPFYIRRYGPVSQWEVLPSTRPPAPLRRSNAPASHQQPTAAASQLPAQRPTAALPAASSRPPTNSSKNSKK